MFVSMFVRIKHQHEKMNTPTPAVIVGRACVIRASSRALVCGFTLPSFRDFVVLSKVFVFAIVVSSVPITGARQMSQFLLFNKACELHKR